MPIPNPTPLTVPATAEKVYPHLWISEFFVVAQGPQAGSVHFTTLPCNAETGEIAPAEHAQHLSVPLWQVVAEVPEAAQAMGAVFTAFPAIKVWQDARIAAANAAAESENGKEP